MMGDRVFNIILTSIMVFSCLMSMNKEFRTETRLWYMGTAIMVSNIVF